MTSPSDLTQSVIDRLMNLREYTIKLPVDEEWRPNGPVPFDIQIKKGIATVTIPALTEAEARSKIQAYFNSSEDDDDGV